MVLWIPFEIALVFLMRALFHPRQHVTPTPPDLRHHLQRVWGVLLPFFVAAVIIQAFAIRWALRRARWSDFRLQAIAKDQGTPAT
jgi:hypothetical protein